MKKFSILKISESEISHFNQLNRIKTSRMALKLFTLGVNCLKIILRNVYLIVKLNWILKNMNFYGMEEIESDTRFKYLCHDLYLE